MTDILLIDDNLNFQKGLAVNLRRAGFHVAAASNGAEGVKLARELLPELILCDMRMPGLDGMGVKRALSEDPQTAEIPFIFLSALSSPQNKSSGLRAGADDYISKPFDFEELIARIHSVLRREIRAETHSQAKVQYLLKKLNTSLPLHTSHQFRTHLGVLLLSLDMIRKNPVEVDRYLDCAIGSAFRARMLVETLIWLNEYDLGRFETFGQQLNLEVSLLIPLEETHEMWKEKHVRLDLQIDPGLVVTAPAHSFTLAVCHLVDNALKFSPMGGTVRVVLESDHLGRCRFTVEDQGPGIPAPLRELVFDRFYQIPDEIVLPQNRGIGLGLYLARSFARTRGGEVRIIESNTGCRVQMQIVSNHFA